MLVRNLLNVGLFEYKQNRIHVYCSRFAALSLKISMLLRNATRVGTNFACAARDYCSKACSMGINKKKSREALFYLFVCPLGQLPLKQLQSLCDRNPRGITFGYAARDHCFVIASEGVTKKEP